MLPYKFMSAFTPVAPRVAGCSWLSAAIGEAELDTAAANPLAAVDALDGSTAAACAAPEVPEVDGTRLDNVELIEMS